MTSTFWDTNGWTDKGKSISADALQMILLMFCFFVLPGCVDPDVHVIHVTSLCYQAVLTPMSKQTFDLEQEKLLPGVIMAAGGQVFDMLYHLADLDETK